MTDFDDKENWNNTLEEELFEHNTNEDVMLEESIGIESIDDDTISDSGKEYILLIHICGKIYISKLVYYIQTWGQLITM